MKQYKFSYKRASCSGKKRIFAISGGRNRRINKESVDAFILRNEIAKFNTRRMKGHDAHPFCICRYGYCRICISERRGSIVSVHFWLGVWRCLFLGEWRASPHAFSVMLNLMPTSWTYRCVKQ